MRYDHPIRFTRENVTERANPANQDGESGGLRREIKPERA
jgi:hypothetical protein